ncbi:hypothetical protein [Nostoc sp. UHCC 0251]|uniref:hypothetical protein n=1 Tax=Nostoc sp. UHCC 0251 TaxID=3110240 RepID=UPI002B1F2B1A|nr:hypothetical protein [Nostoc sp. UHCC 0251]MEA5626269.1 hypothetical protein [Nostoc sp. UHCC 0251]
MIINNDISEKLHAQIQAQEQAIALPVFLTSFRRLMEQRGRGAEGEEQGTLNGSNAKK